MSKSGARKRETIGRDPRVRRGACGLCGKRVDLTKTHVPPQCAGNRGDVGRSPVQLDRQGYADLSRKQDVGGIYVYGLGQGCNGVVQGRWDTAYGELVGRAKPALCASPRPRPGSRIRLPVGEVAPGAVARWVASSAFALSPILRRTQCRITEQLIADENDIEVGPDFAIRLALTVGPRARVTGSIFGSFPSFLVPGRDPLRVMSFAQIYFPPFAWQVVNPTVASLLDHQGWADVSKWLSISPATRLSLSAACRSLPIVVHPRHDPIQAGYWIETLADETCFIVESRNVDLSKV